MKTLRGAAMALLLVAGGCAQAGGLGEILGGVLNAPAGGQNQVSGSIQSVDTRSQQVFIEQSNGQTVGLRYDNNTRVVYQNQDYPVTALERGDQVSARFQQTGNNQYYVDLIQVTQSSSSGGAAGSGQLYTLQGTVQGVDRTYGLFTLSTNNGTITISMPYNPRSTDVNRFNALRVGDRVQVQGVYLNEARFELRQFF